MSASKDLQRTQVDLVEELRLLRRVAEMAGKVTDGAPEWYLKQHPWEQNLAEALQAYRDAVEGK
jgi:hypothetical protein